MKRKNIELLWSYLMISEVNLIEDDFIIQRIDDNYCVIGRWENHKIYPVTEGEEKIWRSRGALVGDII
jgi:hypothetical protein